MTRKEMASGKAKAGTPPLPSAAQAASGGLVAARATAIDLIKSAGAYFKTVSVWAGSGEFPDLTLSDVLEKTALKDDLKAIVEDAMTMRIITVSREKNIL